MEVNPAKRKGSVKDILNHPFLCNINDNWLNTYLNNKISMFYLI
jgi:hypothetical protein